MRNAGAAISHPVLHQHFVKFFVGRRFNRLLLRIRPIVTVYIGDQFPKSLIVRNARRPTEGRADGYDFGAAEASVVVEKAAS
jgi:hypothetical protein